MDLSTKSFTSNNDRNSPQRQNDFEYTISRIDFNKHGIFIERTLALIKPDAINQADEIETVVLSHGFTVLHVRYLETKITVD